MSPAPFSLVADVGGTNTRVALATGDQVDRDTIVKFRNAEHDGIASVLARYLEKTGLHGDQIGGVCAAVAGPVRDGVGRMTNLDWTIDRDSLGQALTARRVSVLNDLQAQGHAIDRVDAADLTSIVAQSPASDLAAKLVIGIGTGFNICPVFDTSTGRFVPPSEAGHASLPLAIPSLAALQPGLASADGYPAVEQALSGRGIETLHRMLHHRDLASHEIMDLIASGDPRAEATGRLFVQILGDVAGNLALTLLPFGGIYLVGGMARAFAPYLDRFGFAAAFRTKGRFSGFMEQFGITVVEDDYAALTGCAAHLRTL